MSNASVETECQGTTRPVGMIRPTHERAVLALNALDGDRVADAEKHIALMPDSPMIDRAWKSLLSGLVAIEHMDVAEIERSLHRAASLALIVGAGTDESQDVNALRLGARALHHLGWLYRRQDRPDDAYRTHLAAYRLREQHGSFEELWETATELGLDTDVGRRREEARRWYRIAIETAEKTSEESARKLAVSWTHLSTSLTDDGRHEEAVTAARTARDWWRKHDISDVTAARADLALGSALLKHGETLHGRCDQPVKSVLEEAAEWLTAAREALLAFGPENAADARLCAEQQDFAKRLLESLDP